MADLLSDLCARGDKAFAYRAPWLSFWQEVAWQFYPQRADFFADATIGEEFGTHLYDEGPVTLRRDLCNAFSAQLRPRSSRWFKPTVIDEELRNEAGVADWLDNVGDIMWRFLYEPRSGFVRATKEADHDFGTFGNAVLSVEANRTNDGLAFRCHHLRSCAWLENADGVIDTMFREMDLTARQIKQRWPKAPLHENIIKACREQPETKFKVWHVMMPADDYEYLDAKAVKQARRERQRYMSVYLDKSHSLLISATGSHEFRYVIPRWQTIQGSPYAVSPATCDALAGARQLQAMARTGIEALEKSIDPPQKAVEGAVRGDINLFAGGTTWIDQNYDERTGPSFELLEVGKNAVLGLQAIDAARLRLTEAMMVSKLSLPSNRAKTAYETQQLVEEYVRSAIPLFEPLEEQYNAPLLEEVFSILLRNGAFGDPREMPDALSGQEIRWSFENPLQQAQEKAKVQVYQVVSSIYGQAAQFDPSVKGDLDVRTATRDAMRAAGPPESWIRDKAEADELAEAEQQAMAAQQALGAVGAAGQAAQAAGGGMAALGMAPI